MIQTAYVSQAAEPMTPDRLLALLQQCLSSNPVAGITGMLLYGNDTFLQVIEGEETKVDALIEKIRKDPRHSRIQFIYRRVISRRSYADWTMGFKRLRAAQSGDVEGLSGFSTQDFNVDYLVQHDAVVDTLMEHFRAPHWDPLVRELDAKDKVIDHLTKSLAHARGCIDIACFVLESMVDASREERLGEDHLRMCESALETLREV